MSDEDDAPHFAKWSHVTGSTLQRMPASTRAWFREAACERGTWVYCCAHDMLINTLDPANMRPEKWFDAIDRAAKSEAA